ncbi:peptidyl-prolyl cis-trans isomerase FKBP5 [Salarias fasciatus]|uniref:Peptidyl-prolyl cis-trans isomerase FKBP5-like n=1 Tax=Salarias fasciatus TaxID=181472 RepID=A0A672GWS9_SALFA|nr:peptidyl-prolyl cis-trans isomerase FKBP5-like [Salarias fasciatus]
MDPADPQASMYDDDDDDEAAMSITSWVSVCPRGLCKVQQKQARERRLQTPADLVHNTSCSSSYSPRLGSLCRVRVRLKADVDDSQTSVSEELDEKLSITDLTDTAPVAFPRCHDSVLQVPMGEWTTLRLGEGQCDVVERCLEKMRAGEKCEILLAAVGNIPDVSVSKEPSENGPLCATVELQAFTPGKESWEMAPTEKWEWVKSHKERGGVRFRSGDVWGAAHSYSQALKLLITLSTHVTDAETNGHTDAADEARHLPSAREFKTMKAELHSNMSLCQLKLNQPERAKDSAAKATELEPGAAKAWYRLGQACQTVGELEEAKRAFRRLLELQPEFPAALKALKDIAAREKATNTQLGLRLSKMFS